MKEPLGFSQRFLLLYGTDAVYESKKYVLITENLLIVSNNIVFLCFENYN